MTTLVLQDAETAADLRTFVSRAAAVDREGGIRLQAVGSVLAAYVAVLPGSGLDASGLVLGMRAMRLAGPAELDVTVPLAGLLDRFARDGSPELPVPPTEVRLAWAGQSPPRSGWEHVGEIAPTDLERAADDGVAEVAQATGGGAAALAVAELRRRVWARPLAEGVPSGVALAVRTLGLAGPEPAQVYRSGRWVRVTTAGGHVLAR